MTGRTAADLYAEAVDKLEASQPDFDDDDQAFAQIGQTPAAFAQEMAARKGKKRRFRF